MSKQQEALELMKENNYEAAAQLFIEAIEEAKDDPIAYINFANFLIQTNHAEEAERFLLKAIELDEKAATAYYTLGNLYYERALYKEAEQMLQHTLKLGLQDSDVFYMLGMTYIKQNNQVLALPHLQRAAELDQSANTIFQYGLVLAQNNFLQEAEVVFNQVLDEDAAHADSLYNLGIIKVHQDKHKQALEYFKQAIKAQANHQLAIEAKENIEAILANKK